MKLEKNIYGTNLFRSNNQPACKEACLDTQPVYGMNRPVLKVYASLNRHRDEAEVTVMGQNIIPIKISNLFCIQQA